MTFVENAGKLIIVFTAITWLWEIPERKQLKDAAAWSVVSAATEKKADWGAFAKKFGLSPKPQKPDKLADFRDQRLNWPDGPRSYEPDVL